MSARNQAAAVPPCILVLAGRERARAVVRSSFPRRRVRIVVARDSADLSAHFRDTLVDAVLLDLGAPTDDTWRAAELAREFPSAPFFALSPMRVADAPAIARCALLDFADILADAIDDVALRDLVAPRTFSARFAEALAEPPAALAMGTPMQRQVWRAIVAHAGRTLRTTEIAELVGVTREHLSRTFSAEGAPNLKRVIDLVRMIAAAELSKNPGYDVGDVARVLGFASSSHLSSTAQRVVGTRPASLSRLRTVDLVERFVHGRGRSRGELAT